MSMPRTMTRKLRLFIGISFLSGVMGKTGSENRGIRRLHGRIVFRVFRVFRGGEIESEAGSHRPAAGDPHRANLAGLPSGCACAPAPLPRTVVLVGVNPLLP